MTRPTESGRPDSLLPLVVVGGALGGLLRWSVGALVPESLGEGFDVVTLGINVVGSFALAMLPVLMLSGRPVSAASRRERHLAALLGPGVLGGFTTLSAVSLRTQSLLAEGRVVTAGGYVLVTVVTVVAAVAVGRAVAQRLTGPPARDVSPS